MWVCKPGGETEWDGYASTLYVQPDTNLPMNITTIMFRIMYHTSLDVLVKYVLKLYGGVGFFIQEPILTYQGNPVLPAQTTMDYENTDCFVLVSRKVARAPYQKSGKLWTCLECGQGKTRVHEMRRDHKSIHPEGIKMLNIQKKNIQPTSWGAHQKFRDGKVEMAPLPSTKPFTFGSLVHPQTQPLMSGHGKHPDGQQSRAAGEHRARAQCSPLAPRNGPVTAVVQQKGFQAGLSLGLHAGKSVPMQMAPLSSNKPYTFGNKVQLQPQSLVSGPGQAPGGQQSRAVGDYRAPSPRDGAVLPVGKS